MKRTTQLLFLLTLFTLAAAAPARAYEVSLKAGAAYGQSHSMSYSLDLEHSFEPFLTGEAYDLQLITNIGGFVWTHSDDTLFGGVLAVGLKFSFGSGESCRPYIAGTVGPALISENRFHQRDLGGAFQFRSRGAVGLMFGENLRHSLEANVTHYSHARIYSGANTGYTAYGLAYAYTF